MHVTGFVPHVSVYPGDFSFIVFKIAFNATLSVAMSSYFNQMTLPVRFYINLYHQTLFWQRKKRMATCAVAETGKRNYISPCRRVLLLFSEWKSRQFHVTRNETNRSRRYGVGRLCSFCDRLSRASILNGTFGSTLFFVPFRRGQCKVKYHFESGRL